MKKEMEMPATTAPAYSMRVFWSAEDEAFIAVCPELSDLSAFGETQETAVHELRIAIQLAVRSMVEDDEPIPAPHSEPSYSGQFRARLPRSLHARLAEQAAREGVSLNTLLVSKLSEASAADTVAGRVAALQTHLLSSTTTARSARRVSPPAIANDFKEGRAWPN